MRPGETRLNAGSNQGTRPTPIQTVLEWGVSAAFICIASLSWQGLSSLHIIMAEEQPRAGKRGSISMYDPARDRWEEQPLARPDPPLLTSMETSQVSGPELVADWRRSGVE